jgi:hypothetical protein
MWAPDASTHVFRGKNSNEYRCCRCNCNISLGERYDRRIHRTGHRSDLFVEVEHANELDCPYDELEAIVAAMSEETRVEVTITMVMSSRLVAKVAFNGETVFMEESYLEMRTENTADPLGCEPDDGSSDTDDEFPF